MPSGKAYDVLIRAYINLWTLAENPTSSDEEIIEINKGYEKVIISLFEERDGEEYLKVFWDPAEVAELRKAYIRRINGVDGQ